MYYILLSSFVIISLSRRLRLLAPRVVRSPCLFGNSPTTLTRFLSLSLPQAALQTLPLATDRRFKFESYLTTIKNPKPKNWFGGFWRRRRDSNSRDGVIRPTPLAGEPRHQLEYFCIVTLNYLLTYKS